MRSDPRNGEPWARDDVGPGMGLSSGFDRSPDPIEHAPIKLSDRRLCLTKGGHAGEEGQWGHLALRGPEVDRERSTISPCCSKTCLARRI